MRTIAITGAASGIGAATSERLKSEGHRVIGVDLHKVDITADLATPQGRSHAIDQILELSGGQLDGLVPCAGLSGLPDRPGSLLVSLNYFGSIALFEGLREALAKSEAASVVGLCSNSTTTAPGVPMDLVEALATGDEQAARAVGDKTGSIMAYPATKMALARWIRTNSVRDEWIGQGINLNAIAPGKTETAMVAPGADAPAELGGAPFSRRRSRFHGGAAAFTEAQPLSRRRSRFHGGAAAFTEAQPLSRKLGDYQGAAAGRSSQNSMMARPSISPFESARIASLTSSSR
jgi:NAD(P)-dependent dehydrogenase (short-subunit alcohol dehydrogenase family)